MCAYYFPLCALVSRGENTAQTGSLHVFTIHALSIFRTVRIQPNVSPEKRANRQAAGQFKGLRETNEYSRGELIYVSSTRRAGVKTPFRMDIPFLEMIKPTATLQGLNPFVRPAS